MNKSLAIAEISITGSGIRTLAPTSVTMPVLDGLIILDGNSGAGKSTLLEVLRLCTQGADTLRDKNILKKGEESSEIRLKICELKDPENTAFYIKSKVKANGEVVNSFQIDVDDKIKTTESPIPELGKLTVAKLQKLMSTSLSYGADQFMSESHIAVRDFILDTFSEELSALGLLIKKGEVGYDASINGRIDAAIAERDKIQLIQSQTGAYGTHLEGLVQPEYIQMPPILERKQKAIQDLADAKGRINASSEIREQKIKTAESEAREILGKGERVKGEIEAWNAKTQEKENAEVQKLKYDLESYSEALENWEHVKGIFHLGEYAEQACADIETVISKIKDSTQKAIENRPGVTLILSDPNDPEFELPDDAEAMLQLLKNIRKEYAAKLKEIDWLKGIDSSPKVVPAGAFMGEVYSEEKQLEAAEAKLIEIEIEITNATQSNELFDKFETLEKHRAADKAVKDLYAERNKQYLQVNCGVKGLNIALLDEEGKRLCFTYDGRIDPEYFGNPEKEPRLLTSYSKSQKVFVAAQLQCYLMSKKQYPLNVLTCDDLGLDNRVVRLYDAFAKKFGLLMLVTSTNDKTVNDLSDNEILIEGGEILLKQ